MIRVGNLGTALVTGAGLYVAWVAGVTALPHVSAPVKVLLATYPVLAPILTASLLKVTPEDSMIEIEDADEEDED